MNETSPTFIRTRTSKIIFVLGILTCIYWWLTGTVSLKDNAILSTLSELAWLPLLLLIFVLTGTSLVLFIRDKFNIKSLNLYTLIICLITIARMFMKP